MDFIDLRTQQGLIRDHLERRIQGVLAHGKYIMGPEVGELEDRLAELVGVKHAIGCSSGTDALQLALMAFQVGPGDAVFTTPFTFIATAEVILLLGATPIFVDIDPHTFNMDPDKLEMAISALASKKPSLSPLPSGVDLDRLVPKGIIVVDLFGLPADYDRVQKIAHEYGLFLIEDAAQAMGGEYQGRKACALGDIGCTSFFPAKPLGGYGDGGMCFTDKDELARLIRSLRIHGKGEDKYQNVRIGINGRLDTLQAAVLLAKLEIFPQEVEKRQQVAAAYERHFFAQKVSRSLIQTPQVPVGYTSVWAQYSILFQDEEKRRKVQENLAREGIPTAVYYPLPLHLQEALALLGYRKGDFPMSEDCARRILSLPMHPYLESPVQEKIVHAVCHGLG